MDTLADFEPLQYYKSVLKDAFRKNAEEYFDDLVKKSGVNVEEHRASVSRYNAAAAKANALREKLDSAKILRGVVIAFIIIAAIAAVILFLCGVSNGAWYYYLGGGLCVGIVVTLLIVLCAKLMSMIKERQSKYDEAYAKANAIRQECFEQLQPLHVLFTYNMTREIIEKTDPDFKFDEQFSVETLDLMKNKYGLQENSDTSRSTVCVLSGKVEGCPFLYERDFVCNIFNKTYTGSLVISWVTYSRDSKGNTHAVTHTQTLYASVTAPAPNYSYDTRLYYGNEAAPSLSFSRVATHAEDLSEEQVERKVKRGQKKLRRKMKKALTSGTGQFTEMGNAEFDLLFGALDRDNEVEFRLLFTPLAQKNMLHLIRSGEAYGDDFAFYKRKMLNCIRSEHAQYWDIDTDPSRYIGHDLDGIRNTFLTFNCEYFRSLYFDFAPLLAIPAYRLQKPQEYIFKDVYESNYTSFETEALANKFDPATFSHYNTKTQTILKTRFVGKEGESDKVCVDAYSFDAIPRVTFVPRMGGDGDIHNVPVYWTEYIPLTNSSVMQVKNVGGTREEYYKKSFDPELNAFTRNYADRTAFSRGLLAIPVGQAVFGALNDARLGELYGMASKSAPTPQEISARLLEALTREENAAPGAQRAGEPDASLVTAEPIETEAACASAHAGQAQSDDFSDPDGNDDGGDDFFD